MAFVRQALIFRICVTVELERSMFFKSW